MRERRAVWDGVPEGLDLLLTHVPPHTPCSGSERSVSDQELDKHLRSMREPPRVHVFGHDHDSGCFGKQDAAPKQTVRYNAACAGLDGRPVAHSIQTRPQCNVHYSAQRTHYQF